MSLAHEIDIAATPERRTFQRVEAKIYGRFMLEDGGEHSCHITDMSPGSAALQTDVTARPGEKCICYLDHIGRIEGVVTRKLQSGFAITIIASDRKKDKIASQLTWLANRHELDLPEDRRHARVEPRNTISAMRMQDGRKYSCRIIDLSLSGAAISTDVRPALGTPVVLGTMKGRVVRHFNDGIAIEFIDLGKMV